MYMCIIYVHITYMFNNNVIMIIIIVNIIYFSEIYMCNINFMCNENICTCEIKVLLMKFLYITI